jgi:hypothetical protein
VGTAVALGVWIRLSVGVVESDPRETGMAGFVAPTPPGVFGGWEPSLATVTDRPRYPPY